MLQLSTGSRGQKSRSLRAFSNCQCISSPLQPVITWFSLHHLTVSQRLSLAPTCCQQQGGCVRNNHPPQSAQKLPLKCKRDIKMNMFEMWITYFSFLCLAFRMWLLQAFKLPGIMKAKYLFFMFVFLLMKIGIVIQSYDSCTRGFRTDISWHWACQEIIVTAGNSIKHLFGLFSPYTYALCSDQQGG